LSRKKISKCEKLLKTTPSLNLLPIVWGRSKIVPSPKIGEGLSASLEDREGLNSLLVARGSDIVYRE
jgi:hypothetical protein